MSHHMYTPLQGGRDWAGAGGTTTAMPFMWNPAFTSSTHPKYCRASAAAGCPMEPDRDGQAAEDKKDAGDTGGGSDAKTELCEGPTVAGQAVGGSDAAQGKSEGPSPPGKSDHPAPALGGGASAQAASTGELKEEEKGGRVIYGKDIDKESDDIKYKWNAIFHKFTPEQKALMALDEVSIYSITDTRSAYNCSRIIQGLVGPNAVITDGCAAAGGNTMSFAEIFRSVNAVELNPQRFELLNSNLKALGYGSKVKTHHGNFLELMEGLQQDVVFLDPPWGGMGYVEGDKLDLGLGGVPLADICERLKPRCRYIALKLPLNFNLEGFRQAITSSLARIDDRSARKTLFLVLDTSGQKHDRGSHKRERDDAPRPWQLKRKS